jgi:hypothetical protein
MTRVADANSTLRSAKSEEIETVFRHIGLSAWD